MNIITVLSNSKRLLKQKVEERLKQDASNRAYRLETYSDFVSFVKSALQGAPDPMQIDQRALYYVKWITIRYAQGKAQGVEDVDSKAVPAIKQWHKLHSRNALRPEHKDLDLIKHTNDLVEIVDSYDAPTSSKMDKSQELISKGEAKILYDDRKIRIIQILSYEAACHFGSRLWCLSRQRKYWEYYINRHKVYFIFFFDTPKTDPEFRWAFVRNVNRWNSSLWNAKDNDPHPTPRELLFKRRERYPVLKKLFKNTIFAGNRPDEELKKILKSRHYGVAKSIIYAEALSLDVWKEAILSGKISLVKYVLPHESIREEVFAFLMRHSGRAIGFILREGIVPSDNVQIAAIRRNTFALQLILQAGVKPSEEVQLAAVKYFGGLIINLLDARIVPSEEVQLAAVKSDGKLIDSILRAGIIPSEAVWQASRQSR